MKSVLVLDLGTTYFKASVFDESGTLRALCRVHTPIAESLSGRQEIAVDTFRRCISDLLLRLKDENGGSLGNVLAVTFSSQTNSFVLLGADDEPLTPIIIWNDQRAKGEESMSDVLGHLSSSYRTTGVPVLTHEFMASKILWYRLHAPEVLARTRRLCLISDYLTLWFTGKHVTEAGVTGLTGLLDIHGSNWLPDALQPLSLEREILADVVVAGTDLGQIRGGIANELGLAKSCRFIVGCLDQYAGAIGSGNVVPGAVSETTGTVLAAVRCTREPERTKNDGSFVGPAFDRGVYYQMAFGDISANLLETYQRALDDSPSFSDLDRAATKIAPGAEELALPLDLDCRGLSERIESWSGKHSRGACVRAIFERVAFALRAHVTLLCGNALPGEITCGGGGAQSALWLQIKADVLNTRTVSIHCLEPASLGAAMLAIRTLTGRTLDTLVQECVVADVVSEPDRERHRQYRDRWYAQSGDGRIEG